MAKHEKQLFVSANNQVLCPGIYLLNFKKYGNYTYGLIECSSNKRRNFPGIKNSNPAITSRDNLT
jgi:hypothetical protein